MSPGTTCTQMTEHCPLVPNLDSEMGAGSQTMSRCKEKTASSRQGTPKSLRSKEEHRNLLKAARQDEVGWVRTGEGAKQKCRNSTPEASRQVPRVMGLLVQLLRQPQSPWDLTQMAVEFAEVRLLGSGLEPAQADYWYSSRANTNPYQPCPGRSSPNPNKTLIVS